jgi:hypothetical protein
MCIKVRKEPKIIVVIALLVSIITCFPFIGLLWYGKEVTKELPCAKDQLAWNSTVVPCLEVDLWSEVGLVDFLIMMTICSYYCFRITKKDLENFLYFHEKVKINYFPNLSKFLSFSSKQSD